MCPPHVLARFTQGERNEPRLRFQGEGKGFWIRRRGRKGVIDRKGPPGHFADPGQLLLETLEWAGPRSETAKPASLGHGRDQFGGSERPHAGLNYGIFDTEKVTDG